MDSPIFNITHLEHAAVALGLQLVVTCLAGMAFGWSPAVCVLGALPGTFAFGGREHAQAESRLYNRYRATFLSWDITLEALAIWKWDVDSQLDFLCPALANAVMGCVLWLIFC